MKRYKKIFKEIISSKERCTNITLESFGICVDKPIMHKAGVYNQLSKKYKVYEYMNVNREKLQPINFEDYSKKFGKYIYNVNTVKQFINYIKNNNITGHFIICKHNHVFAVHSLQNSIFIVDTEEKFISNSFIQYLFYIEGDNLKDIFNNFLKTNNHPNKIKKI